MTTFKKGDPVLHKPDNTHGTIVQGPMIPEEGGLEKIEAYYVNFGGNNYYCAAKDLEKLEGAAAIPKALCLTTGDIIFADPGMVHIAAMYDRPARILAAEEIVHRYNRYEELLEIAKKYHGWDDEVHTRAQPDCPECATIQKCEDR